MSLPRMSWHIGDYLKDTGHLKAAGHGAYFMLCMHYYANGRLPDDDRQLAAIARMSDREWKEHKPMLQAFFHDGWQHKRIDRELKDANDKYEARAAAGKKGGDAKAAAKQNPSNATAPPSNATAKPQQPITLTDNLKEQEPANAGRKRKTGLPENFAFDRDLPRELGWSEQRIDQQIQAFCDYCRAHNKTYADWQAAWRNWVRSPFQKAPEKRSMSGIEGVV